MRKAMIAVPLVALLALIAAGGEDEPPAEDKGDALMQAKLKYSQKVLHGLAIEDFDMVAEGAERLRRLGGLELWTRANTPEYQAQLQIYRTSTGELARLADEKNLDGATLAYIQVTMSCVNCHKVGGVGGSPHPASFTSKLPLSAMPCRMCHPFGAR